MKQSDSIQYITEQAVEWSSKTFPLSTIHSKAAHLLEEAHELVKAPTDANEMADIFLLLSHIAHLAGIDLGKATLDKLEINRNRKWGTPDENGVVRHIKE